MQKGWPPSLKALSEPEVKSFCDRQDSLSLCQGCISGLDYDVTSYVKTCRNCAIALKSAPISKPSLWPTPSKSWERVHIDYAGPLDGECFLLVIDAFTKWPEIVETHRTTSISTIRILKDLFARMGIPTTLLSDNGNQFTSEEFQTFCLENGIDHLTTAPFHLQSNGQTERFVDTFKRAIRKVQEGRTTVREALATFLQKGGLSPGRSENRRNIRYCQIYYMFLRLNPG
ncbi:uncharacterized protein K02A2.6-like [Uranotaenia lowii]|uniref:uncharacterized protein K02A2.6-like n=1 Tax=Uranotaenia lowii TaxID=190385 RepID=UPI0024799F2C|nr:uncharacterized protein K02A2.6-like [Uranotaenia lowii]